MVKNVDKNSLDWRHLLFCLCSERIQKPSFGKRPDLSETTVLQERGGLLYLVGEVEDGSLDCHHKCDPLIVTGHRSIVPICLVDKINLLACHLRLDVLEWWVPVLEVHNAFHVLLKRCSGVGQWSPGIASGCSCFHAPNSSLLHILHRSH